MRSGPPGSLLASLLRGSRARRSPLYAAPVAGGYGALVRRYRVAAGLTQEELAALSGLGVRTISDIERGRIGRPHRSTVDLIARALDRDDLAYDLVRADLLAKAQVPGLAARDARRR